MPGHIRNSLDAAHDQAANPPDNVKQLPLRDDTDDAAAQGER
jgi:hypothetical protein